MTQPTTDPAAAPTETPAATDGAAATLAHALQHGIHLPTEAGREQARIMLPMFRATAGMPPPMAAAVNEAAAATAQAIIHTLTKAGYEITRRTT
jgi:hypothetical protein